MEYYVRYMEYKGQKLLIVWHVDETQDCDLLILDGKYEDLHKAIEGFEVDKCCCDECCFGCGQCIGATLCCMACIDKSNPKKSMCPCAGESCVRRVASVYYNDER